MEKGLPDRYISIRIQAAESSYAPGKRDALKRAASRRDGRVKLAGSTFVRLCAGLYLLGRLLLPGLGRLRLGSLWLRLLALGWRLHPLGLNGLLAGSGLPRGSLLLRLARRVDLLLRLDPLLFRLRSLLLLRGTLLVEFLVALLGRRLSGLIGLLLASGGGLRLACGVCLLLVEGV